MYPTTLNMTRDECRGILRRLELESYSNVVSAFRAQGGLNETKMKILDDLRSVFHISQDRHRAEARRVANDEQLTTIAETISGPNTYQEWCREGRRSFPLLPRTAPLTALSSIANGVAAAVTSENTKLPYPSETGKMQEEQQEQITNDVDLKELDPSKVIQNDPILLANEEKKNLKRSLSLAEHIAATVPVPISKKRTISGDSSNQNQQQEQQSDKQQQPTVTSQTHIHTNNRIQQLYHSHSKTQLRHKRLSSKRNSNATTPTTAASKKSISGLGKIQQNKIVKNSEIPGLLDNNTHVPNPRTLHTYASVAQHKTTTPGNLITDLDSYATNKLPQIATSKKDITNNLSKLNLSQLSQQQQQQLPQQSQQGQNIFMVEHPTEIKSEKLSTNAINTQKFITEDRSTFTVDGTFTTNNTNDVPKVNATNTIFPGGRCNNIKTTPPLVIGGKYHIKTKATPDIQITQNAPSVVTIIDPATISPIDITKQTITIPSSPTAPTAVAAAGAVAVATVPTPINIINKMNDESGTITAIKTVTLSAEQSLVPTLELSSPTGNEIKKITGGTPIIINSSNLQSQGLNKTGANNIQQQILNKPKIPITNQQILNQISGSLKLPIGMQLKGIPAGNRKSVKIISAPNISGKMYIRPVVDSSKNLTNLGTVTVSAQKNLTPGGGGAIVTATASIVSSTTPISTIRPLTVQKLQFIPAANNKQIAISKPNMIFMPTTNIGSSTIGGASSGTGGGGGGGGTIIKGIPITATTASAVAAIMKKNKTQLLSPASEKTLDDLQFSNLSKSTISQSIPTPLPSSSHQPQNNVFVIGAIASEKQPSSKDEILLNKNNMITEDTPVDILTTPIGNIVENSAINNLPRDNETTFQIKPTATIVRSISLNSNDGIHKTTTATILNQNDIQMILNPSDTIMATTTTTTTTTAATIATTTTTTTTSTTTEIIDVDNNVNNRNNTETKTDFIVGTTTDWEMELDQEANKIRNSNEVYIKSKENFEHNDTIRATSTLSDDNYHDVIEEETIDDDDVDEDDDNDDDEEGIITEHIGEDDDAMEIDVTCGGGSISEDIDENVAIEYVEDTTGNLYEEDDIEDEESGTIFRENKAENSYYTTEIDLEERIGNKESDREMLNNNNKNKLQFNRIDSVSNGSFKISSTAAATITTTATTTIPTTKTPESSNIIYEIEQIDGNEIKQNKKNLKRVSSEEIDITSSVTTSNIKKSSISK